MQTVLANSTAKDISLNRLQLAVDKIVDNEKKVSEIAETISDGFIVRARAFAEMIKLKPEIADDYNELARIAKLLNADSLTIIDENGIIVNAYPNKDNIGFDMRSSKQAAEFLPILNTPGLEIKQSSTINHLGQHIQYSGVKVEREGKVGIVQIGTSPRQLENILEENNYKSILDGATVGKRGYIFAINGTTGEVLWHPNPNVQGEIMNNITNGEFNVINGLSMMCYKMPVKKIDVPMIYSRMEKIPDDCVLVSVMPYDEVYEKRSLFTFVFIGLSTLLFGLYCVAVDSYVTKNVTSGIFNVLDSLKNISDGKLDTYVDVRNSEEFEKLSDGINFMTSKIANQIKTIETISLTDPLTEVANRRNFDHHIKIEWSRAVRAQKPLSVLMIDIDKFKDYNDNYGHPQGDVLLKDVSKTIKEALKRNTDMVARVGGEEFAVILPITDRDGAAYVAERIRTSVSASIISNSETGLPTFITVSIGTATETPSTDAGEKYGELVAKADKALYNAKKTGRNKVCVYNEEFD
jgi:diguanylate cyclase (GGDEF)-like protein